MKNGWIKIYRKLRDNPYMRKPAYRAVWVELLLEAQHEGRDIIWKGRRTTLNPGQLTCGLKQLSDWTGVPRGTCKRILDCFKSETMIETQTSNKFSLITIINWSDHQKSETQNETVMKRKRNASETLVKTPKECKNEKNERMEEDDATTTADRISKILEISSKGVITLITSLVEKYVDKDLEAVALKIAMKCRERPDDQKYFVLAKWASSELTEAEKNEFKPKVKTNQIETCDIDITKVRL